jgi:hypothetical protein
VRTAVRACLGLLAIAFVVLAVVVAVLAIARRERSRDRADVTGA